MVVVKLNGGILCVCGVGMVVVVGGKTVCGMVCGGRK